MVNPSKSRPPDWRYLLPKPDGKFEHLLLLGGTASDATFLVEQGIAKQVSTDLGARGADALVAGHEVQVDLTLASQCLAPSAYAYIEFEVGHTPIVSLGRLKQQLHALHWQVTAVYAVKPNFVQPEAYIPLGQPEPFLWYAVTFPGAIKLWNRVIRKLGKRAAMVRHLERHFALTAIRGAARPAPLPLLHSPTVAPEFQKPAVRSILLTGGDALNRAVLLPFTPGAQSPGAVLKFARTPARNRATIREQQVLTRLGNCLGPELRNSIPEARGIYYWNNVAVGIETCAPGYSLSRSMQQPGERSQTHIQELKQTVDWLVRFHRQVQTRHAWSERLAHQWVEQPLTRYSDAFGETVSEARLFRAVRRRARSLLGAPCLQVWTHWGLEMRNIFRDNGRVTVIDWEGGSAGLPLLDLIYFVTHWYQLAVRATHPAARRRAFQRLYLDANAHDSWTGAARNAIARYREQLGLAPAFVPLLFVVHWALRALGRAARYTGVTREQARSDNLYVAYLELFANSSETLFSEASVGQG